MRRPRVLIVDDQPVFRRAARALLAGRGYAVVAEAAGVRSAMEALDRLAPDAVLLDVHVGRECGFEIAQSLLQARPSLRVLMVSVDDVSDGEARARECGARGLLLKDQLARAELAAFWPPAGPPHWDPLG